MTAQWKAWSALFFRARPPHSEKEEEDGEDEEEEEEEEVGEEKVGEEEEDEGGESERQRKESESESRPMLVVKARPTQGCALFIGGPPASGSSFGSPWRRQRETKAAAFWPYWCSPSPRGARAHPPFLAIPDPGSGAFAFALARRRLLAAQQGLGVVVAATVSPKKIGSGPAKKCSPPRYFCFQL